MGEPLDILLINAHRRYLNFEPKYGGFLGIFLLSAFLRREGYNAKGYSGTLVKSVEVVDAICAKGGVYMVGLYCDYENVTENIKLCGYIKEKYKLPVVVGGPQATALKEDFFVKSGCDAVVRYEGELTLLDLMNYFLEDTENLADILGVAYMDNGKLRINKERPLIMNLDSLPFITADCYLEPDFYYRGLSVMTGRGCPFSCAFCHEGTHTRTVRFRSVESVLSEITAYFSQNDRDDIYVLFTDDILTLDSERLHKLCEGIAEIRKTRPFRWFCEGHVHSIYKRPEMVQDLVLAGCTRIQLGIEAGTDGALKAYGKRCTTEEIVSVVKMCSDAGISQIYGNIILAGAHFSREIFEQDKIFVEKLIRESKGTLEIGVVTFWPLPDTPMTKRPEDFGITILDNKFITSAGDFPQSETDELSRIDVAEMQLEMEKMIDGIIYDMLFSWQIPTERILSWFGVPEYKEGRGVWFWKLSENELLYSYYETLYLKEGRRSSQVEDLKEAHPMRIAPLYKYLKRKETGDYEILGERFDKEEIDVILLTAGKLSVNEIVAETSKSEVEVTNVLNRLEDRHFIVYTI